MEGFTGKLKFIIVTTSAQTVENVCNPLALMNVCEWLYQCECVEVCLGDAQFAFDSVRDQMGKNNKCFLSQDTCLN